MLRIMGEKSIVMRQKIWWLNFGISSVLFLILGYFFVDALKNNKNNSIVGPIAMIFFEAILFIAMVAYSEKITVKEKNIEVEIFFFLKKSFLIDNIDKVILEKEEQAHVRYKSIAFIVNNKKVRMLRKPSELWNNFDELIMFLKKRNIKIEQEK